MDAILFTHKHGEACRYRDVHRLWGELPRDERLRIASSFYSRPMIAERIRQAADVVFRHATKKDNGNFGKTAMFTYNGPWGLMNGASSEPADVASVSLTDGVERLRADAATVKQAPHIFSVATFQKQSEHLRLRSAFSHCLLLKTSRGRNSKQALHPGVLRHRKRVVVPDMSKLIFQDSRPHASIVTGGVVRDSKAASFQGALYLSSLKKGSIFTHSTREPFTGYLVQPSWLMNYLQAGKISFDTCRSAVIKTCQNVGRYLKDLDLIERVHREAEVEEEVKRVAEALAKRRRPFITLGDVDA